MHASDVIETIVDGEVLYDNGAFPRIDAKAAKETFLASVQNLVQG